MKKILLFLILCMVLSVFSACGENAVIENDDNNVNTTIDLDGYDFVYASPFVEEFFVDEGVSDAGDKINARYREIEQAFNCTISSNKFSHQSTGASVLQNAAAGIKTGDLLDYNAFVLYELYKVGLLLDYESIGTINLNDTKWSPEFFRKPAVFDGLTYGTFQYEWLIVPQYNGIMLANLDLLKDFGQTNPHDLIEQKQWTWDNFAKILEASHEKVEGRNIVSIVGNAHMIAISALYSNGVSKINTQGDKAVFGYSSVDALQTFDWLKAYVQPYFNSDANRFPLGTATFCFAETWHGTLIGDDRAQNTIENMAFVPFPDGPKGNSGAINAYVSSNNRFNALLDNGNDLSTDDLGRVLNALFAPLEKGNTWKEYAHQNLMHTTPDYNEFVRMIENINYDYAIQLTTPENDLIEKTVGEIFSIKSKSAVESIEKIADRINLAIDAAFN